MEWLDSFRTALGMPGGVGQKLREVAERLNALRETRAVGTA